MKATIHFYIRSERPNKDNTAKIYLLFSIGNQHTKITLSKSVPVKKDFFNLSPTEFANLSTSLRQELFCWDTHKEKVTIHHPNYEKTNQFIDSERKRANDIILKYELMNKPLTVGLFRKEFCKPSGDKILIDYFSDEFDSRRTGKWSAETLKSYRSILTKINQFKPNLTLNDIDYKFLTEFENYMLLPITQGGCGNCERTVGNNMKVLKTLLYIAIKNGDYLIENSPFKNYKIRDTSKELTTRDYLEPSELQILERLFDSYIEPCKPINKLSVEEWKEREKNNLLTPGEHSTLRRFLFSCYTGLRFRDMLALDAKKHLFKRNNVDGANNNFLYYIEIQMHKTKGTVIVPLIDKAIRLIDVEKNGKLLDMITNQKVNQHLKSIQKKSKLDKHLTFHVSRHSFATICFLYGIDERVGQKLLGHRNRKFTEIYTHLSHNKIFDEMSKFNKGINSLNTKLNSETSELKDVTNLLSGLSSEKLEQVKSIIRLLG
ncbi:site-specific integrase [Flavobacterium filum]|mgnify:CR=1 FL=1|uniref:site-specific integrase n=1 Tax=Flavobacterium filum TaxID=370974 RepID=UPI0023F3E7CF|nr:site-specific integrase [Flavobacterium filum]